MACVNPQTYLRSFISRKFFFPKYTSLLCGTFSITTCKADCLAAGLVPSFLAINSFDHLGVTVNRLRKIAILATQELDRYKANKSEAVGGWVYLMEAYDRSNRQKAAALGGRRSVKQAVRRSRSTFRYNLYFFFIISFTWCHLVPRPLSVFVRTIFCSSAFESLLFRNRSRGSLRN